MAIYAANNLFKGIKKFANNGGALFSGIIANSTNLPVQEEIVEDFASRTKTTIAEFIPRSLTVTKCELEGKTVIEGTPESEQADAYRDLAKKVLSNRSRYVPSPLDVDQLKEWAESLSDRLLEQRDTPQHVKCELECVVPGAEPIYTKPDVRKAIALKATTTKETAKARGA